MELLAGGRSIGYLLKSRVTDVADFIETLQRVAKGASVVDPALVQELVSARRRDDQKHVRSILTQLNLPETGDDHRRVLAVIAFLEAH